MSSNTGENSFARVALLQQEIAGAASFEHVALPLIHGPIPVPISRWRDDVPVGPASATPIPPDQPWLHLHWP